VSVEASGSAQGGDASTFDGGLEAVTVPWSTGFEDGFGDWSQPADQGLCYVAGAATYAIVTQPVHSGQYAAAFTVDTADASPSHTRCFRQGVLPVSAYYGAWYYLPSYATNYGVWNLFHFQGADGPDAAVVELWDLSLASDDGGLAPFVRDFQRNRQLAAGATIPIGAWFHLEVRLTRSATNSGEVTVYVDGNPALDVSGLVTDPTSWGQWFVGNYATSLFPPSSTVYVDDVSIDTTGP
jgi:hypothetical protein